MKIHRWLAAGGAATFVAAACAQPRADIKPKDDERIATVMQAAGSQVYVCRVSDDAPTRYEWSFVAPEADLYDASGRWAGRHYAGPTWQAADGSRVKGSVAGRVAAKSEDTIPWLLLAARPVEATGLFGRVTSIQRVETVGGATPKEACGAGNAGVTVRVPYSAQYVFFTR